MKMNRGNRAGKLFMLVTLFGVLVLSGGCSDDGGSDPSSGLRINELQYLGTHNSYHIKPPADIFGVLLAFIPDLAPTLEYSHVPLTQQFEEQGIRQIELDVFYDPEGGLYADRHSRTLFGEPAASGIPELSEPGLKVLHVQEVDYETTCLTFVLCLQEIKAWSDEHPTHLPIMVLVEAKDDPIADPLDLAFTVPLPFGAEAMDRIDVEIRSVFGDEQLIQPDDVRGDAVTLEQAVLTRGWPLLSKARGKIMFALDNGGDKRDAYTDGHPSLEGRVLFTDSPPGTPEAAFMKRNGPVSDSELIMDLVRQGYIVRTRADSDTVASRTGDTTQRDIALATGAQFISTDYPVPNLEFSDYQVVIPGGGVARCNPINPGRCTDAIPLGF